MKPSISEYDGAKHVDAKHVIKSEICSGDEQADSKDLHAVVKSEICPDDEQADSKDLHAVVKSEICSGDEAEQLDCKDSLAKLDAVQPTTAGSSTAGANSAKVGRRSKRRSRFRCDWCGQCFSRAWKLKAHRKDHIGESPFVCQTCYKCFRCHSHLRDHARIHTRETPFECTICGKKFTMRSHVKLHVKKFHNGLSF